MNKTSTIIDKKKSFSVFEEHDNSRKNMIQFLTKVGSIQNLQNISGLNRFNHETTGGSPDAAGSRLMSASTAPFFYN